MSLFLLGLVDKFRAANFWVQLGVTVIPSAWGGGASLWVLSHIQKKKKKMQEILDIFLFLNICTELHGLSQEKPLD